MVQQRTPAQTETPTKNEKKKPATETSPHPVTASDTFYTGCFSVCWFVSQLGWRRERCKVRRSRSCQMINPWFCSISLTDINSGTRCGGVAILVILPEAYSFLEVHLRDGGGMISGSREGTRTQESTGRHNEKHRMLHFTLSASLLLMLQHAGYTNSPRQHPPQWSLTSTHLVMEDCVEFLSAVLHHWGVV